jgi:hypothetical protein
MGTAQAALKPPFGNSDIPHKNADLCAFPLANTAISTSVEGV